MIANYLFQTNGLYLMLGVLIILFFLLLWIVSLHGQLSKLHRRYQAAMGAIDGCDIENLLADQRLMLYEQAEQLRQLQEQNEALQEKLMSHAGHVALVRFNPFRDTSGNQSFAVAWVNKKGNGLVISSLYTRGGSRLYAKPVQNGISSYILSQEEEQAIQTALTGQSSLDSKINQTEVLRLPPFDSSN